MDYTIYGCEMQGVSTILAMPQWYVNYNFSQLLRYGKTKEDKSLQDVDLTLEKNKDAYVKGVIAKITTELVVPDSPRKINFIITFSTGTMQYFDLETNQYATAKIDGLVYGFTVDLNLQDLENNPNIPEDVKKQVEKLIKHLGEGAFTIQQLFMDFTNASISQYNPTVTVFPEEMNASARSAFPYFMQVYIQELSQVGGGILGYGITVNNPGNVPVKVATFPPTSLDFVTNQYKDENNQLNSDYNTINYLMMTGNRALPGNLETWWGNFITPKQGSDWYGTLAEAKSIFIDQFILDKLGADVNVFMKLKDTTKSVEPDFDIESGSFTPTTLGGTFSSGVKKGHSHKTNTFSNDDGYYEFSVDVTLAVQPKTNQIIITRKVKFSVTAEHWYGIENHALKDKIKIDYAMQLKITIELQGVVDGELQVNVTKEITPEKAKNTAYADPYGWWITGVKGSYPVWLSASNTFDKIIGDFAETAAPESILPNIEKTIKDNLNFSPFIFPGGNQLFMNNPSFNEEGDLIVGLSYKS